MVRGSARFRAGGAGSGRGRACSRSTGLRLARRDLAGRRLSGRRADAGGADSRTRWKKPCASVAPRCSRTVRPRGTVRCARRSPTEMTRKGTPCDAIVDSRHQRLPTGLELAFRAFVDPGDAVVVEDPTYTRRDQRARARWARRWSACRSTNKASPRSPRAGARAAPAARHVRPAHVPQPDRAGDGRGAAPGRAARSPRGTAASSSRTTGRATCASRGAISRRCTRWTAGSTSST